MGEIEKKMVFYGKLNFKYNLLTPRGTLMLGSHICNFASATCCYAENLKKMLKSITLLLQQSMCPPTPKEASIWASE